MNQDLIMSWFDVFYQELPLFLNYKNYPHGGKHQHRLVKYALKHLPHQELRSELFNPFDPSNIESYFYMKGLGKIVGDSLLAEMHSKRKAARNHLSSQNGILSWGDTTDLEKKAGLVLKANDDVTYSSFGSLSEIIKNHSMTSLTNTGEW